MKKLMGMLIAAAVLTGGVSVYAGSACCAAGKAKGQAKAGSASQCGDIFAKLNLTDAQKEKLAALQADCERAVSTSESREKFAKGIREILTPEQLAQCKAECEKAGVKNCPAGQSVKAKDDSKS
jgi:Spy/CpxP family protein refolding chaperone